MAVNSPAAKVVTMREPLTDMFERRKRKLRLSLTDRCQFRCHYCMGEQPKWLPKDQLLRQEEIARLAALAVVELGVEKIRLTGGEPTLRADVVEITEALQPLRRRGLRQLSMTTNAARLSTLYPQLAAAGLDDFNISLDALDPALFKLLTKQSIDPVLNSIETLKAAGAAFKINTVLIRDYNENQLLPLVEWAVDLGVTLRFIEFMPLDNNQAWDKSRVITQAEILQQLEGRYRVSAMPSSNDPANYFSLDNGVDNGAKVGVIPTVSEPFCGDCDRIRLTAKGQLYSCLFAEQGLDLLTPLRDGANDNELVQMIRAYIWKKPAGYIAKAGYVKRDDSMHVLGG